VTGLTLVVRGDHHAQFQELAAAAVEQAAVLLVGRSEHSGRLLLRDIVPVRQEHLRRQTPTELTVTSEGYMPALARAEQLGAAALWLHTHPEGEPRPSRRDRRVDRLLAPVFVGRSDQPLYGSLQLAASADGLQFAGHVYEGGRWRPISRLWIVGDRLRLVTAVDAPHRVPPAELFDRQVRAFGPAFQRLVGQLTVCIVGNGGTGSATAEQLARLGVGRLVLVDDDAVSASNVTRIHEAARVDVGRPKAEVLAGRLRRLGTGTRVTAVVGRITSEVIARELLASDVVFGCTDDQGGRAVLSRLAYWYLTPVIDMGFLIDNERGVVRDLTGRVTTMLPGSACLFCRGRIDAEMIRLEAMPLAEREQRVAEGYAPALGAPAPAVVAFTTLVAALGVSELIERLIGYDQPPPDELLALVSDRRILRSTTVPDPFHFCGRPEVWGRGDEALLMGRTWSA
jgi:proteasome lid subunit RPN8/RPN11